MVSNKLLCARSLCIKHEFQGQMRYEYVALYDCDEKSSHEI